MTNAVKNFWDSLSKDEADYVQAIMDELKDKAWSAPVVAGIRDNGGIVQANKDRMFELRFGYALDQVGIVPQYEIPGEGQSTIDSASRATANAGAWKWSASARRRR